MSCHRVHDGKASPPMFISPKQTVQSCSKLYPAQFHQLSILRAGSYLANVLHHGRLALRCSGSTSQSLRQPCRPSKPPVSSPSSKVSQHATYQQHRRLELHSVTVQLTEVSSGLPHHQLDLFIDCKVHHREAILLVPSIRTRHTSQHRQLQLKPYSPRPGRTSRPQGSPRPLTRAARGSLRR
jgi:hypothetical protein